MAGTFDADAQFLTELCGLLTEACPFAVYPVSVPAGVTPTVPYALVAPSGGTWDRGPFEREHSAGWRGVQVTAVGKGLDRDGVADFLWAAGQVRSAIDVLDLHGTGWKVADAASDGPPSQVESSVSLVAVGERFVMYVQGT